MKRLLSILIVALLLCAPFTCASAKTVTGSETFTAPGAPTENYTFNGEHFSIACHKTVEQYGFSWGGMENVSITSIDGSVIDRIEAKVTLYGSSYGGTTVTPGTKRETGPVEDGTPILIYDIDSTEFATGGNRICYVDNIVVYYHLDVPETGDTATPALWLSLALASAGGLAVLAVRRRREL